jgi:hypothetical protein
MLLDNSVKVMMLLLVGWLSLAWLHWSTGCTRLHSRQNCTMTDWWFHKTNWLYLTGSFYLELPGNPDIATCPSKCKPIEVVYCVRDYLLRQPAPQPSMVCTRYFSFLIFDVLLVLLFLDLLVLRVQPAP